VLFVSRGSQMRYDILVCFPIALLQITLEPVCLICSLERPGCLEFSPTTKYMTNLYPLRCERAVPYLVFYYAQLTKISKGDL